MAFLQIQSGGRPVIGVGTACPELGPLRGLGLGNHLFGDQTGLNALEKAFQPSDQLGLGDAHLR